MADGARGFWAALEPEAEGTDGAKGGAPTPFVNSFLQTTLGSLRYNTSQAGSPLPIVYGTCRVSVNFLEFWGYQTNTGKGSKGGGGKSGGGGKKSSSPNSSVFVALGICQGPISFSGSIYGSNNANRIWANAGIAYGPSAVGLNAIVGNDGQAPDPVFASQDPNQPVIGYSGTAYCTGDPLQLGQSTAVPNVSFEITGFMRGTVGTEFPNDANPAYIITDMISNVRYGAGFPVSAIDSGGSIKDFANYCQAVGLGMSLLLDRCQPAAQWVETICQLAVAAPFFSAGLLKIVPYALTAYASNGGSWTPNLVPQYSVADRDFIDWGGDSDPVIVTRSDPTMATNWFGIEYYDASNAYNPNIAYSFDQGAIDQYGLRNEAVSEGHAFTSTVSAQVSSELQLRRKQLILNTFKFQLGWVFALLDPMDVIEITDLRAGLNAYPVRITSIEENDNGELSFLAEDMPGVPSQNPRYNMVVPTSHVPGILVDPGPVNPPVVFALPTELSDNQGLELAIAVCGVNPALWGGCFVYVSTDGNTYAQLPRTITTPARMGVLSAPWPLGPNPDTVDVLHVDLTESQSSLTSGTQAQADQDVTLAYIGHPNGQFEWISYTTATLQAQYKYALGGYTRRAQFSSKVTEAAPVGSSFVRVDASIYQVPYQAKQIGSNMWLKFVSFNIFGGGLENVADVVAYEIKVPPPPPPNDVTGFGVAQNGNVVSFSWNPITDPFNDLIDQSLKGFDIGYTAFTTGSPLLSDTGVPLVGDAGQVLLSDSAIGGASGVIPDWSQFIPLTQVAAGTEMTNAEVPPGTWVFGIRAHDIADQLSPDITTAVLSVINANQSIYSKDEAPLWPGAKNGFVRHYTGVLTPEGTKTVDQYVALAPPPVPVLISG
jgi:hypothetical protein